MLDPTHLRYFREIARHGSLTLAARVLRVTQPTLTFAVRRLEESLRTTLLYRGPSGVTLTSTGQALLAQAEQILALIESCEQDLQGLASEAVGSFVVGC